MPKTQKPPVAKGERRGKHREKRLKMLEVKPHWLANDAPYGRISRRFCRDGAFLTLLRLIALMARMNSSGCSERT